MPSLLQPESYLRRLAIVEINVEMLNKLGERLVVRLVRAVEVLMLKMGDAYDPSTYIHTIITYSYGSLTLCDYQLLMEAINPSR